MVICADTSALFSLYAHDVHSSRIVAWLATQRRPLLVTLLNECELANALRFAEWRGAIGTGQAAAFWAQFQEDQAAGRVVRHPCNLATVMDEAMHLSAAHTLVGGHRSFDIVHVAAAIVIKARHFHTFDHNQRRLAEAEGLGVPC
ncbi:MAG: type II toxin-antitoxin system VapC family toxin [Planctomycetia bacterium]